MATGQQILLCALLESSGSNIFNRANNQGKSYTQALSEVKATTSYLKRVFEGDNPNCEFSISTPCPKTCYESIHF